MFAPFPDVPSVVRGWPSWAGGGSGSAGRGLVVNVSERKGLRARKTPVLPNPLRKQRR